MWIASWCHGGLQVSPSLAAVFEISCEGHAVSPVTGCSVSRVLQLSYQKGYVLIGFARTWSLDKCFMEIKHMLSKTLALGVSCQSFICISVSDRILPFVGKRPSGNRGPDLSIHAIIQTRMLKLEGSPAFIQALLPTHL